MLCSEFNRNLDQRQHARFGHPASDPFRTPWRLHIGLWKEQRWQRLHQQQMVFSRSGSGETLFSGHRGADGLVPTLLFTEGVQCCVYSGCLHPATGEPDRSAWTTARHISKHETTYPDAVFVVAGDFNHCYLRTVLPQHVSFPMRDNNILDHVYSNVKLL